MPAPFQLLASNVALDFVNTLDDRFATTEPKELLPKYTDLLSFLEQSKALESRYLKTLFRKEGTALAKIAVRRAHHLREALASVFYGIADNGTPPPASLKRVERYYLEAQEQRELSWKPAHGVEIGQAMWDWPKSGMPIEMPVWVIARAAEVLLTSPAIDDVHECASASCRWLFLDTSKNHSRRWCDMAICGNRMKARRFQARRL